MKEEEKRKDTYANWISTITDIAKLVALASHKLKLWTPMIVLNTIFITLAFSLKDSKYGVYIRANFGFVDYGNFVVKYARSLRKWEPSQDWRPGRCCYVFGEIYNELLPYGQTPHSDLYCQQLDHIPLKTLNKHFSKLLS